MQSLLVSLYIQSFNIFQKDFTLSHAWAWRVTPISRVKIGAMGSSVVNNQTK